MLLPLRSTTKAFRANPTVTEITLAATQGEGEGEARRSNMETICTVSSSSGYHFALEWFIVGAVV